MTWWWPYMYCWKKYESKHTRFEANAEVWGIWSLKGKHDGRAIQLPQGPLGFHNIHLYPVADPGGALGAGPPRFVQIHAVFRQFQGKNPILSKVWAQGPHGGQNSTGPPWPKSWIRACGSHHNILDVSVGRYRSNRATMEWKESCFYTERTEAKTRCINQSKQGQYRKIGENKKWKFRFFIKDMPCGRVLPYL